MLFKRYGNPLEIMRTYSLGGLYDFILYLFDKEQEDILWSIWLNKDIKDNFKKFKAGKMTPIRNKKTKKDKQDNDNKAIAYAGRFIKDTTQNTGGGDVKNEQRDI